MLVLSLKNIINYLKRPDRFLKPVRSENIQNKMTKEEIIAKLTTIVKPYIHNEEGFKNMNEDTDFIKDLDINSANLVDIILDVEDEFDIHIDNDSMEKMLSVRATVIIIQEKMKAE